MHSWLRWVKGALIIFSMSACQPQQLSSDELNSYIADPTNSYHQVQHANSVEVGVTFQPTDLLVSRDIEGFEGKINQHDLDSIRGKYNKSLFFLLSFSKNGHEILQPREGFSAYSQLLQTLAFQMRDYVQLTTMQGDTLRPANYYLDRTYATGSASRILLAFPTTPKQGTWRFHLSEFGLGTGNLVFAFDSGLAFTAPALKID